MNQEAATQVTLTLGALFGQDVAAESFTVFKAVGSLLEALGSAALSFDFRHFVLQKLVARTETKTLYNTCRIEQPVERINPAGAGDTGSFRNRTTSSCLGR